jgi:hypothetical protein
MPLFQPPAIHLQRILFLYVIFPSLSNFVTFHNLTTLNGSQHRRHSHRATYVVVAAVPAVLYNLLNDVTIDFSRGVVF